MLLGVLLVIRLGVLLDILREIRLLMGIQRILLDRWLLISRLLVKV